MAGNALGSANRTKRPFTIPKLRPTLLSDMWTYHSAASRSTGLGNAGTMHARSRSWRARSEMLMAFLVSIACRRVTQAKTIVKIAIVKVEIAVRLSGSMIQLKIAHNHRIALLPGLA